MKNIKRVRRLWIFSSIVQSLKYLSCVHLGLSHETFIFQWTNLVMMMIMMRNWDPKESSMIVLIYIMLQQSKIISYTKSNGNFDKKHQSIFYYPTRFEIMDELCFTSSIIWTNWVSSVTCTYRIAHVQSIRPYAVYMGHVQLIRVYDFSVYLMLVSEHDKLMNCATKRDSIVLRLK